MAAEQNINDEANTQNGANPENAQEKDRSQEQNCPMCGRHCPTDDLSCGRGEAWLAGDASPETSDTEHPKHDREHGHGGHHRDHGHRGHHDHSGHHDHHGHHGRSETTDPKDIQAVQDGDAAE